MMRMLFYIFCTIQFLFTFSLLEYCFNFQENNKLKKKAKKTELIKSITTIIHDSKYSLDIVSYSIKDPVSEINKNNLHCVVKQELLFKINNKIAAIKLSPLKVLNLDKKTLKYVINEITVDVFKNNKIYFLNLYSSNGEAEYNYVYDCNGVLLFYQKCYKNNCNLISLKLKKDIVEHYFNRNKFHNFIEVKDVCF